MKLLNEIVVVVHLLGMAAIVGGWLAVRHDLRVVPSILWGARVQVFTGLVLAGIASMDKDDPPNNAKLAVKLLVALVVMALSEMTWAAQKKAGATGAGSGSRAATATAGSVGAAAAWASRVNILALLTVLNVVVAALWRSYS